MSDLYRDEAKTIFLWKKKTIQNGRLKKTGIFNSANCIFSAFTTFLSLRLSAWWPQWLSHINDLHINLFYSPNLWNFRKKYWKLEELKISVFFWVSHAIFFHNKKNSFALSLFKMLTFYVIPRMGQYFDDYPDFQQKVKGV